MSLLSTGLIREYLGLPAGDKSPNSKLAGIISAVENFCDSFTNRKLEAARYNSHPEFTYFDGTGDPYIYTYQYPLSWVNGIWIDADRAWGSGTEVGTDDIFYYPNGKIYSEAGYFTRGHRNVKIDYIAGYAPVVGGTHDSTVSTYPLPADLQQVMVEMCAMMNKEGMMAIRTIPGTTEYQPRIVQMLSSNSFWSNVLTKYKAFDKSLSGYWE